MSEFVDTNILIYAHDRSAGPKHDRASDLVVRLTEDGRPVIRQARPREMQGPFQGLRLQNTSNPPGAPREKGGV